MATKKQKAELIEKIKFTPCTYTVRVHGYGGEMVMGKVNNAVVEFFKENNISLSEYATSWAEEGEEGYIEVPELFQPFSQSNWYDCDSIEHCSGAEFGGSWLTVEDENGNEVLQVELGSGLEELGCEVECFCTEDVEDHTNEKEAVFVGQSFEKGQFFEAGLELTQAFDITKFKFMYSELSGWSVLNSIEYDGEELDGSDGYSTTGKSSSFTFYYQNDDGDVESYEEPE